LTQEYRFLLLTNVVSLTVVIRPQLPLDILGQTIGETEDAIVSMFAAAQTQKAVLILDGLEHVVVMTESSSNLERRMQSTFLTMMDSIQNCLVLLTWNPDGSLLPVDRLRLDRTIVLDAPNALERQAMLVQLLQCSSCPLLDQVVESTVGKSRAQLALLIRQAKEAFISDNSIHVLQHLQAKLVTSQVVQSHDLIEWRVVNATDLSNLTLSPLQNDMAMAYQQLEVSLVLPLCKSQQLFTLLDHRRGMGGILLAGPSGSGKSTVAMACAKRAASLLPTVKVLDVSCTSLIHKEVGGSEQALHSLFDSARRAAPCMLILDGIETIAATRGNDATTEGTMDRVLSTLLVELDGVDDCDSPIAVIGITLDASWIDSALKRPGRLEKVVYL
jgi:SpoVK/Ycf46/Vps4 family AAA+-type ATPase